MQALALAETSRHCTLAALREELESYKTPVKVRTDSQQSACA
jgi:hypothetical protein